MISVKFDPDKTFLKELNNIVNYSLGFIEGANKGKAVFLATFGERVTEITKLFIDSMARQSPESMHHVYEWYQVGSPNARLFDINFTVSNLGLSLKTSFRQSVSIQKGSNVPFYNKAAIMESGASVVVKPRKSDVLVFEKDGETIFTKNAVSISNPGGSAVAGSFQQAFDSFINNYFSQSFMQSSGIRQRFGDMTLYNKNISAGIKLGRSAGISAGFRWIANVGVGV